MTVHGRHSGVLANSPVWDDPYNALPGVDRGSFALSNIPGWAAVSDLASPGAGVAIGVPVYLRRGDIVSALTFVSGGTGATTPAHWWHALCDPDDVLLAQSADQATAAWAANTAKKLSLVSAVTISKDGWYTAATMTDAATPNTLAGAAPLTGTAAAFTGSKALGRTFGSGLAATAPAAISSPTTVAKCPLVIVS